MGADPAIKYVLWRGRFFGVTVNLVFSTLSTCARVGPKTAYILDIFCLTCTITLFNTTQNDHFLNIAIHFYHTRTNVTYNTSASNIDEQCFALFLNN